MVMKKRDIDMTEARHSENIHPAQGASSPADRGASGNGGYLEFIGYVQVIGIILVVLGHSFHEYPDGVHGVSLLVYRLCYSFHMPLFIFVSGFLMIYPIKNSGYELSVRRFTVNKLKRLFIPYIVLTLITFIPRAALSGMADDELPMTWSAMFRSLYITDFLPIPFFWYLQASLLLLLFSFLILALGRRLGFPDILSLGIVLTGLLVVGFFDGGTTDFFGYKQAIKFGIYFIGGAVYSLYYSTINRVFTFDKVWLLILSTVLWLATFFFAPSGVECWRYLTGFLGIAMVICIAKLLVKYKVSVLDHLKGANYMIFLLSWYINVTAQQVLAHFVELPWWIHTIISLTFGIYIPWLAYIYLRDNHHRKGMRIISFLLGQSFRKR